MIESEIDNTFKSNFIFDSPKAFKTLYHQKFSNDLNDAQLVKYIEQKLF